jgi:CHAT domain-containing protein
MSIPDRSLIRRTAHRCSRRHISEADLWVIIDAAARPDLLAFVTDPRRRLVPCPRCGRKDLRIEPLLVLIETPERLVGVVLPGRGAPSGPPPWFDTLEGGPATRPIFTLGSYPAAAAAVTRQLARDLKAPEQATMEVALDLSRGAAEEYGELLSAINTIDFENARLALIGEAVAAPTEESFRETLARHPELLADVTLELLDRTRSREPDVRIDLGHELLSDARRDPAGAWRAHRQRIDQLGASLISGADTWMARLEAARGDPQETIALASKALEYAVEISAEDEFTGAVLEIRAAAHLSTRSGRRDEHLACVLADYEQVLALTPRDHRERSGRLLNVAVALGMQVDGEHRARVNRSAELLREALTLVDDTAEPARAAILRTNLALALLQGAGDEELPALREALSLCELALSYRSPERNAEDWAYTEINRGAVIERLAAAGEAQLGDARTAYDAVIARAGEVSGELVAHARLNLLCMSFAEARREDEDTDDAYRTEHADLVIALAGELLADANALPLTRGRALRRLGGIHRDREEVPPARVALEEAVKLVDGADLHELQQAAWDLAALESEEARWPAAASAYRHALSAADALINGPADRVERLGRASDAGRLSRWAANAFVMLGELEEAVITLENGRTRELSRQLQLEDPQVARLERIVPHAVEAWREAIRALSAAGADARTTHALAQALKRIHAVPGFERFGFGADLATVRAAASPGSPVVYINPSPYGTTLIRVPGNGAIDHRVLPVTSGQIISRVLFGLDDLSSGLNEAISYTLATAANAENLEDGKEPPDLAEALDRLLPWIGEHVCADIQALLESNGDTGGLLVACGALAAVPLAAAPYGDDAACLLDRFTLTATPSATAHAAARRRAERAPDMFAHLVAVADPNGNLEHARTETAEASALFAETDLATGPQATCAWLNEHAGQASVLHLACHGYGGMIDATDSGFIMADGTVSGVEVTRLGPLRARLAIASACQTAVTAVGEEAGEAFSLAYALLAAGSACTIASLWPVDDLATAILMARFYEEVSAGLQPPDALARAQRWLRGMDDQDAIAFLARHPTVATEFDRRRGPPPGGTSPPAPDKPFAHPEFWAPFIALGV